MKTWESRWLQQLYSRKRALFLAIPGCVLVEICLFLRILKVSCLSNNRVVIKEATMATQTYNILVASSGYARVIQLCFMKGEIFYNWYRRVSCF